MRDLLICLVFTLAVSTASLVHENTAIGDRIRMRKDLSVLLTDLAELEEEQKSLAEKLRSAPLQDRTTGVSTFLFSLYSTGTQCGTGNIVSGWIELLDIAFGVAGNIVSGGILTIPTPNNTITQYWFCCFSFLCRQDSTCDVRMKLAGSPIAAAGNRDDFTSGGKVSGARFAQFSNCKIFSATTGQQVVLTEEAGGGNPNNCKRSGSFIHNTFNCFLVTRLNV